jgi:hypothetical protein
MIVARQYAVQVINLLAGNAVMQHVAMAALHQSKIQMSFTAHVFGEEFVCIKFVAAPMLLQQ